MRVVYDGPIDRVEITLPGDRKPTVAARGDVIEVPPEFGEHLLRQSIWRKAPAPKAPKPAPANPKAAEAETKEEAV